MLDCPVLLIVFLIACFLLICVLSYLSVRMLKSTNEYRYSIEFPVIAGILSVVAYCIFLCSTSIKSAIFWDGIFFIGTDWLAMSMMLFAFHYTERKVNRKLLLIICSVFCGLDTISLLVNNFTHHMFILESASGFLGSLPVGYLSNVFYFPHYIHLGMCYVMVVTTFVLLGVGMIKVPRVYKSKYKGIFITYLIVILANFICYSFSVPVDFSVIFYAVLAAFICYFSTYFYPKKLINTALGKVQKIMSDAVVYFDVDGNCIFANDAAKSLFDMENDLKPSVLENYRDSFLEAETDTENLKKHSKFLIDGNPHQFEIEYKKIYSKKGKFVRKNGSIMIFVDKTEEVDHYNREKNLATHDLLTGILNRIGFIEEVDKSVREDGVDGRLMICSNIMDFKLINDLFGHLTGDQLLKKQAKLLNQFAHKNSIFGRIGDDKFALFVNKTYFSEQKFNYYMEEMQKLTASSFFQMRIHVGVYEPHGDESAESMYNKALLATETISSEYNKKYAFYDSFLMEQIKEESEIIDKFHKALEENQFKMYLQPIVNESGEVLGSEILARWYDPVKGIIYPEKFIPVLEKYGLIYKFDEFVWREAVKILKNWKEKGFEDKYICVNVSKKDIFYTDIFATFKKLVDEYQVNPKNLHIEVSESILVTDFEKACNIAIQLRKNGFVVAIDDFGCGDSSLNMLKNFEADVLKLDVRMFLKSEDDFRNDIIIQTIIELATELKMEVVPEALETHHQFTKIKNFGCKAFQGNYFYEPMTVPSFESKFYH